MAVLAKPVLNCNLQYKYAHAQYITHSKQVIVIVQHSIKQAGGSSQLSGKQHNTPHTTTTICCCAEFPPLPICSYSSTYYTSEQATSRPALLVRIILILSKHTQQLTLVLCSRLLYQLVASYCQYMYQYQLCMMIYDCVGTDYRCTYYVYSCL